MTTQRIIDIRSTNIPPRGSIVVGDSQVDVKVSTIGANFIVHISPVFSEQAVSPFLTRLAEVLPRRMSKTYVEQLRACFPQPPAIDDPATYEFETHQD